MAGPLDDLLPIRTIMLDGQRVAFAPNIEFSTGLSAEFVAGATLAQNKVTVTATAADAVTRTAGVALSAAQAWADMGAVIAIEASTTTFFELSIQAAWPDLDGGLALGGPDSQSATVQLAVTRDATTGITVEQRDGGTEWTFETSLDGVATTVVQVRALDGGSGTWKLQVRRGATSAATSVATITASVRALSSQAWSGDTATTWIDPDGDATHAPALARIAALETPSQTVHTADGALVINEINICTSAADGMTLPDAATNAGKSVIVINDMAATDVTVTSAGSDTISGGSTSSTYVLPSGAGGVVTFIASAVSGKWYASPRLT